MVIYNNDPFARHLRGFRGRQHLAHAAGCAVHLGMRAAGRGAALHAHLRLCFGQWFLSAFFAVLLWGTNRLDGTAGRYDSPAHMMATPVKIEMYKGQRAVRWRRAKAVQRARFDVRPR